VAGAIGRCKRGSVNSREANRVWLHTTRSIEAGRAAARFKVETFRPNLFVLSGVERLHREMSLGGRQCSAGASDDREGGNAVLYGNRVLVNRLNCTELDRAATAKAARSTAGLPPLQRRTFFV
jgi:hypothetical protein